jgi:hypothetical protein
VVTSTEFALSINPKYELTNLRFFAIGENTSNRKNVNFSIKTIQITSWREITIRNINKDGKCKGKGKGNSNAFLRIKWKKTQRGKQTKTKKEIRRSKKKLSSN